MRTNLRRAIASLVIVVPLGLAAACGGRPAVLGAPPGPPVPVAPQATTSKPPAPMPKNPAPKRERVTPKPRPELPDRIQGASLENAASRVEPDTTLGAMVYDRTTGNMPLEYNANRAFRSASLVKLLIAIDVLEQGADQATRWQVSQMLATSDDNLASMFWVRDGGPGLVTRTKAELGLAGVRPPEQYGRWGEVVVTPRDVVTIYRYVLAMRPADRTLIVDALAQAPRYAADGFDQHFGIPDGMHAQWAVKQGWGNNGSAMVLHSTGLAGPGFRYVVVLLTQHPLGSGWETAARSVTAAAKSINGHLPGVA